MLNIHSPKIEKMAKMAIRDNICMNELGCISRYKTKLAELINDNNYADEMQNIDCITDCGNGKTSMETYLKDKMDHPRSFGGHKKKSKCKRRESGKRILRKSRKIKKKYYPRKI
jgi:hypothetical protein